MKKDQDLQEDVKKMYQKNSYFDKYIININIYSMDAPHLRSTWSPKYWEGLTMDGCFNKIKT